MQLSLNENNLQIPGTLSLVSDYVTTHSTQLSYDNQQQQTHYIKKPAKLKGLNPAFVRQDIEFQQKQLDKVIMVTEAGEIVKLSTDSDELKKFIEFSNIKRQSHDLKENQLLSKFNETKLFKVKKSNSNHVSNFNRKKRMINDIISRDLLKSGILHRSHRNNRKRRIACIKSGSDLRHKRLSHKKHQRHTLEEIIKIYHYSNKVEFNSSSTLNFYHHGKSKKSGEKRISHPLPVKCTIGCQTQKEFFKNFPSRRRKRKQIKSLKPLLHSVSCQTSFRNLKKKTRLLVCPVQNEFEQNNWSHKNDSYSVNNSKKNKDPHFLLKKKSHQTFETSKSNNLKVLYRNDHRINLNSSTSSRCSSVISLSDISYGIQNELPVPLSNKNDNLSKTLSLSIDLNQSMKSCQSATTQVSISYQDEENDKLTTNEQILINSLQNNTKINDWNRMEAIKFKSHKMNNYKRQYGLIEMYKRIQNYYPLLQKVNLSTNLIFVQYLPLLTLILSIIWLIHSVLKITFPIEFLQFGFRYIYTLPFHLLRRKKSSKWEILFEYVIKFTFMIRKFIFG